MSVETTSTRTGSHTVVDPARRPDVLFRVRRQEGAEMSAWWPISAFLAVSVVAVTLLGFIPGAS